MALVTLTLAVGAPVAASETYALVDDPGATDVTLDALLGVWLAGHPDWARARRQLQDRVLEADAAAAVLRQPLLSADLQLSETRTPQNQGITQGIVRSERYALDVGYAQPLPWGGQVRLGVAHGIQRSFVPLRFDDFRTEVESGPVLETALTATVVQPLLRGFGRERQRAAVVASLLARDRESREIVALAEDRLDAILSAWEDLQSAAREMGLRHRSVERARRQEAIATALAEEGRIAGGDVLLAEQRVLGSTEAWLASRQAVDGASRRLALLVDADVDLVRVRWRPAMEDLSWSIGALEGDQACTMALRHAASLDASRARIEEARHLLRERQAALLPQLDASATLGFRGLEEDPLESYRQMVTARGRVLIAGLVFTWPIGQRVGRLEVERAAWAVESLEAELEAAARALCRSVLMTWAEQRALDDRLALALRQRGLAERVLDQEERRLEAGLTTVQATVDLGERLDEASMVVERLRAQRQALGLRLARWTGELARRWIDERTLFGGGP